MKQLYHLLQCIDMNEKQQLLGLKSIAIIIQLNKNIFEQHLNEIMGLYKASNIINICYGITGAHLIVYKNIFVSSPNVNETL